MRSSTEGGARRYIARYARARVRQGPRHHGALDFRLCRICDGARLACGAADHPLEAENSRCARVVRAAIGSSMGLPGRFSPRRHLVVRDARALRDRPTRGASVKAEARPNATTFPALLSRVSPRRTGTLLHPPNDREFVSPTRHGLSRRPQSQSRDTFLETIDTL